MLFYSITPVTGLTMRAVWPPFDATSGQPQIVLNAQLEREAFYQSLGFSCRGEVLIDAGIAHRAMILDDCND